MSIKELNMSDDDNDGDGIEAKEVNESDLKNVPTSGNDAWVNERRNPIKLPIVCKIPQRIVIVMRSIERIMSNSNMGQLEFGLFLTGKFQEDGSLLVGEDYFVPAQKVSGAAIDFDEEPPEAKYNGVIHRHPNGCTSFSGTDGSYINKNFEFSLLYVNNDITMGIFNLEVGEVRIQLPLNISVMYPVFNLDTNEVTTKIQRQVHASSTTSNHPILWPGRDRDGDELPGFHPGFPGCKLDADDIDVSGMLRDPTSDDSDEESATDENEEKMYQCKRCGQTQFIIDFPIECEGCDIELNEGDVEAVNDLTEETE